MHVRDKIYYRVTVDIHLVGFKIAFWNFKIYLFAFLFIKFKYKYKRSIQKEGKYSLKIINYVQSIKQQQKRETMQTFKTTRRLNKNK